MSSLFLSVFQPTNLSWDFLCLVQLRKRGAGTWHWARVSSPQSVKPQLHCRTRVLVRAFLEVHVKDCLFCTTRKKILQSAVIETHIPNFIITAFSNLVETQLGRIVLTSPPVSSPFDAVVIVLSLATMSSFFSCSSLSQIFSVWKHQQQTEHIMLIPARCLGEMEFKWLEF